MGMYYYVPLLSYDGGKPAIAFIFPPLQFPHSGAMEENMGNIDDVVEKQAACPPGCLEGQIKRRKHNLNPNIDDGKRKICTDSNFSSSILELWN